MGIVGSFESYKAELDKVAPLVKWSENLIVNIEGKTPLVVYKIYKLSGDVPGGINIVECTETGIEKIQIVDILYQYVGDRITIPKQFVEENRRFIGKEFVPTVSFTGNVVLKRV